ncbi:uncharacterized protein LOC116341420 [Contarinia nasturtii]|uniref:uncharacterized protein LOC116341420 n=1 Tax=Contarinia nasturtii TaxID=265458 RepID=UPI0012D3C595|nr:uncharacterized protein LOC116341420 [Contarinia nasturtii]
MQSGSETSVDSESDSESSGSGTDLPQFPRENRCSPTNAISECVYHMITVEAHVYKALARIDRDPKYLAILEKWLRSIDENAKVGLESLQKARYSLVERINEIKTNSVTPNQTVSASAPSVPASIQLQSDRPAT